MPIIILIAPRKGACGKIYNSQIPATHDNIPNILPKSLRPINVNNKASIPIVQNDNIIKPANNTRDSMVLTI